MQKQMQTFMIDQVEQTKKHETYEISLRNDAIRWTAQHHKIVRHDAG